MLLTPCQPIDVRRTDRFRPPHCPRPECPAHRHRGPGYRYKRDGWFRRACDPQRREPRFRCKTCGRGFSRRTFCTTYRLRRPELLEPVAGMLVAGSALRQIARHLGCAPSTVLRLSVRLGRHATLFQLLAFEALDEIQEPVVLDHFETFVRSQLERLGIATPVGQDSWFVFPQPGARYQGSTRRSRRKRALRRAIPRPAPGAVVRSTCEAVERLKRKAPGGLDLVSDEHPAVRVAVRRCGPGIRHRVYANPDRSAPGQASRARERDREMFAVDLLHKLYRHCQAHHRRETIAIGRKTANVLGRAELLAVWRNFIKLVTERRPTTLTPAIRVGLARKRWSWRDVLAERLFERRIALG